MNRLEVKLSPVYTSALRYLKHGWECGYTRRGEKAIFETRGVKHLTADPEELLAWLMEYEGVANLIGTPPAGTLIMDVDLYKLEEVERNKCRALVMEFVKRTGASAVVSARGGIHLLVAEHPGITSATIRALFHCDGEVKRNRGGYVLLPGSVFEGKFYKEIKGHEMDGRPAPAVPASVLKPTMVKTDQKALPLPDAPPLSEAKEMLKYLDPDCGYEEWMRVGFALHAVYGETLGYKIWDWWSKKSLLGLYEAEGPYSTETKWGTIKPEGKERIVQLGTLVRMAREGGYGKRNAIEDFGPSGWYGMNTVGPLLAQDPPALDWVLHDVVQRGKTALLAGAGGSGKSMLLYRIGVMAALGWPHVLGLEHELFSPKRGGAQGRVFMLSAEEDRDDTARRIHAVTNSLALSTKDRTLLGDRLSIMAVAGMHCGMVNRRKGGLSDFAEKLIDEAKAPGDVDLLILDPSVFFGGGADVGTEEVVEYMRTLTYVAREANVGLLLSAHIRKGAELDKDGKLEASAVKGNTAFVDLARGAWLMASMTSEMALQYRMAEKDAVNYVGISMAKTNYTAQMPDMIWMQRGPRGALIPPQVPLVRTVTTTQARATRQAAQTVEREVIKKDLRKQQSLLAILQNVQDKPSASIHSRAFDLSLGERTVIYAMKTLVDDKLVTVKVPAVHHTPATYALTAGGRAALVKVG